MRASFDLAANATVQLLTGNYRVLKVSVNPAAGCTLQMFDSVGTTTQADGAFTRPTLATLVTPRNTSENDILGGTNSYDHAGSGGPSTTTGAATHNLPTLFASTVAHTDLPSRLHVTRGLFIKALGAAAAGEVEYEANI
jgi:hypothetical protein